MKLGWMVLLATACFAGVARAAGDLNLFAWSEYVPQEVIDGFTKETGIAVHYETYASNEEMVSKLLAGAAKYDLIQPSDYMAEALIRKHKLAKIDWGKVPNVRNIAPEFRHLPGDAGDEYTVPWMTGTVGIVVNTDRVKEKIEGYKDVFRESHKGRIVVVNDARELVTWVLSTQGKPINTITDENLEGTRPVLAEWVKLVRVFDSDSPKTALLNGDVDLGVVWSGEAALCWKENHKFEYVLPAEGAHRFIDLLAIPAGAPHKAEAQAFMNYILRPEVSKRISDKFPYTNPNLEARKLLSKEELDNPASYPKDDMKLEMFRDIGTKAAAIDRLVTEVKGGG